MQPKRTSHPNANRVRFVFDDAVISLGLGANATFEDIARALNGLARRHHDRPVAIDVTLAALEGSPGRGEHQGGSYLRSVPSDLNRPRDEPLRARTILVVDDDHAVRNVVVDILEDAGFMVLAAFSATTAFRLLERHHDIAVLRRPDLKVVYTTGYADHTRSGPAHRYGPVLPKPYRAADLVRTIEQALAQPSGLHGALGQ